MSDNPDIIIDKIDEATIVIHCASSIFKNLYDYFSFFARNYKFMPKYESGVWDGKIRLIDYHTHITQIGLIHELIKFSIEYEYSLDIDPDIHLAHPKSECPINIEELFESFNLKFDPYDYQENAIEDIFRHKKRFLLSPTSSGKSFIIYGAMRQMVQMGKKILIVCPTTHLVDQIVNDFDDYSENNDFDAYKTCHRIYSGKEKSNNSDVTVSTWQSIYKKNKTWFGKFDAVFIDEAHLASGASLTGIMDKCTNAEYRIGLSGTIDDAQVHKFSLIALFGRITITTTTRELIDRGITSNLKIVPILMKQPDLECSRVSKLAYQEEIDEVVNNNTVNKFICKLAIDQKHNTLILYRLVGSHGYPLYEMLLKMNPNKKVFFIAGSGKYKTPSDERVRIQKLTEIENDVIIVASFGTFSTGVNIKNIHNIILAHPLKGKITLLQSIGRALRKSKIHNLATVYDIVCDYTWKSKSNTTFKHFKDRLRQYVKAKFDIKITKVKI